MTGYGNLFGTFINKNESETTKEKIPRDCLAKGENKTITVQIAHFNHIPIQITPKISHCHTRIEENRRHYLQSHE